MAALVVVAMAKEKAAAKLRVGNGGWQRRVVVVCGLEMVAEMEDEMARVWSRKWRRWRMGGYLIAISNTNNFQNYSLQSYAMAPMYIVVREIKKNKATAAIKLRAVRTYDVLQSRFSEEIKSIECVLHDQEGAYVHLHIPGKNVSIQNKFIEGNVYCIKNFLVVQHYYTYKTCSGPHMLKLFNETLVKGYKGLDFPTHMYRLQSFTALKTVDPKVLVDVIGRVVEIYSPLDKLISGRPSRLIDFLIEDLNGNQLKCTVWDQHVEKVLPYFRKDFAEPVIVLIQMGRVKVSENSAEVKITSSYDATQLLFNGDSTEFLEFRESYGNSSGGDLSSPKMRIITISDIFQNREVGEFWVPAQIIGIESDVDDWFYQSCKDPGCNKKVELINGMFQCSKCSSRYDDCIYRYKIKVRVVDLKGTAPFLLWDREALDLVSVRADELVAKQPKVMIKIPKELKTMVGRGLFFKVNVQKNQLDNLSHVIPVMSVKHFPEMFNTYCPGLLDDYDDGLSSKLLLTDNESDSDEGFFSEEEAESPNVNAVKEQTVHVTETDAVKRSLLDQFSSTQNSKKKRVMVVKEEKGDDDKET
ncbi:replication protein A 70 kDa DNA-binding subunit A-like [Ipomoea triloba]|uniref:replication protein A 70 kDa DNA-binding subunit A-like n=1 Tax=Ipomoea triloba TaxID=35885 RepID=UPI00125E0B2B|nr:replication protein A 70 kDa DNA-binding subunit A-like [Ipomoea triloba]